jgi:hypothetical protein
MQLHRHPCGFFYSQPFADFLSEKNLAESPAHGSELLALEYVRCREGPQAGNAWWQLTWVSLLSTPAHHRFFVGETEIALSRQTLTGLSGHLLHYSGGQVVVKR